LARSAARLSRWPCHACGFAAPRRPGFRTPAPRHSASRAEGSGRAQFFQDASANISSSTQGFSIISELINWAPCAVQLAPGGVGVSASALNIQPDSAQLCCLVTGWAGHCSQKHGASCSRAQTESVAGLLHTTFRPDGGGAVCVCAKHGACSPPRCWRPPHVLPGPGLAGWAAHCRVTSKLMYSHAGARQACRTPGECPGRSLLRGQQAPARSPQGRGSPGAGHAARAPSMAVLEADAAWCARAGIVVTPQGINVQPQGFNVQPTARSPTRTGTDHSMPRPLPGP